jgi:hypothetical protein
VGIEWLADISPEVWTAFATVAIAALTLTLWLSTRRQAILTREAIRLSRDQFLSFQRPELRLRRIWFVTVDEENPGAGYSWLTGQRPADTIQNVPLSVAVEIVNIGRTDAFLEIIKFATLYLRPEEHLPQRPPYDDPPGLLQFMGHAKMAPGSTMMTTLSDERRLNATEFHDLQSEECRLYYVGTIGYKDGAGNFRQTGFCRFFGGPINASVTPMSYGPFRTDPNPEYEYQD